MPGGIMQIVVANSPAMGKIVGNPQFSYFTQAWRRPANFSTEWISVAFETSTTISQSTANATTLAITRGIPRSGDLLLNVYFSFVLPDIYSDDTSRFQWIQKIGCYMIREVRVMLSGQIIERFPGEWIDVHGELCYPVDKRGMLDRMTGNTQDIAGPVALENVVTVFNNDLLYAPYPGSTRASSGMGVAASPSIRGRRIYVPLPLWFSKSSGNALPLVALQGTPVQIEVDVRPWSELYQLWDRFSQSYCSPANYPVGLVSNDGSVTNLITPLMGQFLEPAQSGGAVVDLRAQLECEYGFLGKDEIRAVANNIANVLIETCRPASYVGLKGGSWTQDLNVNEPTKELVWIVRRANAMRNNEWSNLTNASPEDASAATLRTGTMLLNRQVRMDPKDASFFDTLQPFQHHSGSPRPGIYVWSFSLNPERMAPSGLLDMSSFANKQLQLVLSQPPTSTDLYQVDIFAVTNNFLNILCGEAGIQFIV